jgi:hypothetical protein
MEPLALAEMVEICQKALDPAPYALQTFHAAANMLPAFHLSANTLSAF